MFESVMCVMGKMVLAAVLLFVLWCAVVAVIEWWMDDDEDEELRKMGRALGMTVEELIECSKTDLEGPVAKAVPYLCQCVEDEAVEEAAWSKPYAEGHAFALERAAGMVAACRMVRARWQELLEKSAEAREKREKAKGNRKLET